MANTYTQLLIHAVFAVKHREAMIDPAWEKELYRYLSGTLNQRGHKALAINGTRDHTHLLFGLNPTEAISDLIREIKKSSNQWITENSLTRHKFEWQAGYGAFSQSRSQLDSVVTYINNQKEHHRKKSFREEYLGMLKKWEVPYEEQYVFDWLG